MSVMLTRKRCKDTLQNMQSCVVNCTKMLYLQHNGKLINSNVITTDYKEATCNATGRTAFFRMSELSNNNTANIISCNEVT